jgi:glycosyltransferase involved in cell wall biosynthesis
MTTTWTVVSHGADDSTPAIAVGHLMAWLDREPSVTLHTVLWAPGPAGTAPFDFGRLTDIGSAHHHPAARALRSVGLGRVGGAIAGRAVRAKVKELPSDGVLYLSTTRSAAVLRYLAPGNRIVITHLHAFDRESGDVLSPDRIAQLREATDVWLATDEDTRSWASETLGVDETDIVLVAEPVDPTSWNRAARRPDPTTLRLGLAGAAWFGSDHSGRLVQILRTRRPELSLELVWAHQVADPAHLAPLVHDLDHLGAGPLQMPRSSEEVLAALDDIDAMAVTTPTDEGPWVVWEAAARGVPVVCFATHPGVPSVREGVGLVVDYPDVAAMADAVLAIHDEDTAGDDDAINARRAALRRRDVTVIGPKLLELANRAGAR